MRNYTVTVIFTYPFNDELLVYLFKTEDEAKKFLIDSYEEQMRIDIEENKWDIRGTISEDGWYAKIENYYSDGRSSPDITQFRIGVIYN